MDEAVSHRLERVDDSWQIVSAGDVRVLITGSCDDNSEPALQMSRNELITLLNKEASPIQYALEAWTDRWDWEIVRVYDDYKLWVGSYDNSGRPIVSMSPQMPVDLLANETKHQQSQQNIDDRYPLDGICLDESGEVNIYKTREELKALRFIKDQPEDD